MDSRETIIKNVYEKYKRDIRDTRGITNKDDITNMLIACLLGQTHYFGWAIKRRCIDRRQMRQSIGAMRILVKTIGITLR